MEVHVLRVCRVGLASSVKGEEGEVEGEGTDVNLLVGDPAVVLRRTE